MTIPIQGLRLKQVREEIGETQTSLAEKLDVGTSTTDYERGRTRLTGKLVAALLENYHINPLWLYGKSEQKYLDPHRREVSPKAISVDNSGQENILMVHAKAAAGYADNLSNPEYYEELPAFTFPLPEYRNASFRGFQVEGFSMMPSIQPEEWIITKAIGDMSDIKNGNIYVVVEDSGIRIKRIIADDDKKRLTLISINPEYPTDQIAYDQVKEIWEFYSKITQQVSLQSTNHKLDEIHQDIKDLRGLLEK